MCYKYSDEKYYKVENCWVKLKIGPLKEDGLSSVLNAFLFLHFIKTARWLSR